LRVLSAMMRSFLGCARITRPPDRFDQLDQPLVTGGRLDHGFKRTQSLKKIADRSHLATRQPAPQQHSTSFINDANHDNLLVEVDADVLHRQASCVETNRD
jgi:hypothetical protein